MLDELHHSRGREIMITIRIEGLEDLIKKMDSLASMRRVKGAIFEAAEYLKDKVADYPHHVSRPNPLIRLDPKVRRGFFYHLNKGDIEVPYRRGSSPGSEKLGQSWNISTRNAGFTAIIGTGVSYAKLVQESANQTSYHRRTGWITTKQVKMIHGKRAIDMIQGALHKEVTK
jgi:hypothetical protein